jgi:SAM-dependent methyltransferase
MEERGCVKKPLWKRLLPKRVRRQVARGVRSLTLRPPVGQIAFGDLRRLQPVSADWGFDRGTVIDRYYIDRFLSRHAQDVKGRVLEIGGDKFTRTHGGARVTRSDVLHVEDSGPPITIVGDLVDGAGIESGVFDCVMLTQTLNFVYDVPAVVRTVHRILAPGGVALVTVPGITKISRHDMDRWGQYWCFTTKSARRLFEEQFASDAVAVEARGNVLTAMAFLQGIAAEELTPDELDYVDRDFETLIGIRAQRTLG